MVEITLPEQVKELSEELLLNEDGLFQNDMLHKYLVYSPEVIRIYGLAIAKLKRLKRDMEINLWVANNKLEEIKGEILTTLDPNVYKNEQVRLAKVVTDSVYKEKLENITNIKREISEIEEEIDELTEYYWKFKSVLSSLDNATKLIVSERKY